MKLAILIPTYNRAAILTENLSGILRDSLAETVSIYVSDNCSSDNTESVMRDLQSKNRNVFYKRNPIDIGFDDNLLSLMRWAEGDYVWFMGDDDYILEGALDRILGVINSEGVDALILNGAERPSMRLKSKLVTKIYDDVNEVAKDLWLHASWMSSIVIKKELLDGFDATELKGSQFMHLQALFYALSRKDRVRVYCSNEACLTFPAEDDTVNSHTIYALYSFLDRWDFNINRLPAKISANTREICFMKSPIRSGKFVRLRGMGVYGVKDLIRYKKLINRKGLLFPAVIAVLIPPWLCRLIMRVLDWRRRTYRAALP